MLLNKSFKMQNIKIILISILTTLSIPFIGYAATLYLTPQTQSVYQGDSLLMEVMIDTEDEEINIVEASLSFSTDLLLVGDISIGNSIINLWAQRPSQNSLGKISFVGGITNGFKGDGLLAKINFSAKDIGQAKIGLKDDAKVLLNDGKGTEVQLKFLDGSYEITARPKGLLNVSSESHPEQNKWYNNNIIQLYWDLTNEAEYSYLLSHDPLVEPDNVPNWPEGELVWVGALEYKGLEDGVYYFTAKQKLPEKDWSNTVRFKAMIDTVPPKLFEPKIGQDPSLFTGKYFLSFNAADKTSGINYYEIKEQSRILGIVQTGKWQKQESPYLLTDQSLRSIIKVKVVDKAGNEKIVEIVPAYKPTGQDVLLLISLFAIGIFVWIFLKRIKRRKQNQ